MTYPYGDRDLIAERVARRLAAAATADSLLALAAMAGLSPREIDVLVRQEAAA